MGRLFFTGDTHGNIDIKKLNSDLFELGKELTRDDYLIILGDFGLIWGVDPADKTDEYWIKWLNDKPWTTLFVDGNHENFNRINNYPVESWHGGNVHRIADNILHLMRGQVFEICGSTFFTFGGAISTDRGHRRENISWWRDELPTKEQYEAAIAKAEEVQSVDYILAHTCPYSLFKHIDWFLPYEVNIPATYGDEYMNIHYVLEDITQILDYKKFLFGHYHMNEEYPDYKAQCIYNNIYELIDGEFIRVN